MFIGNFLGTYEHPSNTETLKTIKQKHDESLHDYVKHFCNARNAIPHIQDIEIINTFYDGVSDIKTVEEIAMKKPKTVADLLVVADVCVEASEAWARLLESRGKGPSRKKDDREVSTADKEIGRTAEITSITASSPRIRRRRDPSDAPMTLRNDARFIVLQDMIYKSAKLFGIAKRCCVGTSRSPLG
jgi:hypothetical protein